MCVKDFHGHLEIKDDKGGYFGTCIVQVPEIISGKAKQLIFFICESMHSTFFFSMFSLKAVCLVGNKSASACHSHDKLKIQP